MKQTALKRKTRLKNCTPLTARKGLNKISDKQRIKQTTWKQIGDKVTDKLDFTCQWCGTKGHRDDLEDLFYLGGHHILPRRFNDYARTNFYLCHNICHGFITGNNIDILVTPSLTALREDLVKRWQLISNLYPRLEGNVT